MVWKQIHMGVWLFCGFFWPRNTTVQDETLGLIPPANIGVCTVDAAELHLV